MVVFAIGVGFALCEGKLLGRFGVFREADRRPTRVAVPLGQGFAEVRLSSVEGFA